MSTQIAGADYVGEPARTWQMYRDDMVEAEFAISLGNEGEDALYVNSGIMERVLRVRMFSIAAGGELQERPVSVSVRGVLDQDGSGPFITLPDQQLLLEGMGKGSVIWIVAVAQADGRPFAPGRYQFETEIPNIRSAIVTLRGGPLPDAALQPWSGVTRGQFELRIAAPSTPTEVAAMHLQHGSVAFERRKFEEAAALFRQAVDADPSNSGRPLYHLGATYLTLGRYTEALSVLQQLPLQRQSGVEAYLAEAYVGIGNEAEAITLFRRGGWTEAQVGARLEELRERVKSRPLR